MNHKGTKTIETKSLLLRKFTSHDTADMYTNWASKKTDTFYVVWKRHESKTETEKLIKKWVYKNDKNKQYVWCVENKATGTAIGEILIDDIYKEIETGHISFCFSQAAVSDGQASEAMSVVVKFLFQEVQMKRLQTAIDIDAAFEQQVLTASGFNLEGTHRQALKNNRGVVDCHTYAILRDDFLNEKTES